MDEERTQVFHKSLKLIGRIPSAYDLTADDMDDLISRASKGTEEAWNAIAAAFRIGFLRGNHCTINRQMKKI